MTLSFSILEILPILTRFLTLPSSSISLMLTVAALYLVGVIALSRRISSPRCSKSNRHWSGLVIDSSKTESNNSFMKWLPWSFMKASRQKYQQSLEMIQQIRSASTPLWSMKRIASKAVLPAPITNSPCTVPRAPSSLSDHSLGSASPPRPPHSWAECSLECYLCTLTEYLTRGSTIDLKHLSPV